MRSLDFAHLIFENLSIALCARIAITSIEHHPKKEIHMYYPPPSQSALNRAFLLLKAAQLPKPVEPHPEFETLRPADAAETLGVDVRAVRKAIHSRKLKAFRIGKRNWRIRVVDLQAYLDSLVEEWCGPLKDRP